MTPPAMPADPTPRARALFRTVVVAAVVLHGLLHLLGAPRGVAWVVGAALVTTAGVLLARPSRWWWPLGVTAAVVSQSLLVTAWAEAQLGTVGNVLLLAAAVHAFAAYGPWGARAVYRRRVAAALAEPPRPGVVTEGDLADLPALVAAYLRRCGAVGQARVTNFRARIHGRIRAGADKPWMAFTGEQVDTCGERPNRLFFIDATMFGLPVDVLHVFVGDAATMRVKLCSLLTMVDARGPEMDRAETVTVFNDLCVLAPAALVDLPVRWQTLDARRVRGAWTRGAHTVSAELVFDDDGDLVDFLSDDRSRSSADGKQFVPERWSTPIGQYRAFGARRAATFGEARWHSPEGEYAYLEFYAGDIVYNVGAAAGPTSDV